MALAKRFEAGEIGVEAEPAADFEAGEKEERSRRRIAEEGHCRGDRDIGAHRDRQHRRADDLQARDHQENADEQPGEHPARHRSPREAPQLGVPNARAERPQPAAGKHFVLAWRVAVHEPPPEAAPGIFPRLSHEHAGSVPGRASSRVP